MSSEELQKLLIFQGVIAEKYKTSNYAPTGEDTFGIYKVYKYWQKLPLDQEEGIDDKISKTLRIYERFLKSDASPYTEKEREDKEFVKLIASIKPGGLFHHDLKGQNHDSKGERIVTFRLFTEYMTAIFEKLNHEKQQPSEQWNLHNEVKLALSTFPPERYACIAGTRAKIIEAKQQLNRGAKVFLHDIYDEITHPLLIESQKSVYPGNHIHIPAAVASLVAVSPTIVKEIEHQYTNPYMGMSAEKAWGAYCKLANIGSEIAERILFNAQETIKDNDINNGILVTPTNIALYLDSWGIADVLKEFYDAETFQIKRSSPIETNEQLQKRFITTVVGKMKEAINESLFKNGKSLDWSSVSDKKELEEMPTLAALSSKKGFKWITDQIKEILNNDHKVENVKQDIALRALFIFSQQLQQNKPAMVVKVLHELGGKEEGIDRGLKKLNLIGKNNDSYKVLTETIEDRCDFYCRNSINNLDYKNRGIKEYVDYLKNPQGKYPKYLLHVMIQAGASVEEVDQLFKQNNSDLKEALKEADGNGCTPLYHAANQGKVDVLACLYKNDPVGFKEILKKEDKGGYPLAAAANTGQTAVFEWIFEQNDSDLKEMLKKADGNGRTPLYHAAAQGKVDVLACLFNNDPVGFKELLTKENKKGYTPLAAANRGHEQVIEFFKKVEKELTEIVDLLVFAAPSNTRKRKKENQTKKGNDTEKPNKRHKKL